MRTKLIAVLVILALALTAVAVTAQGGPKAGPGAGNPAAAPGDGWGMGVVCEQLKAELNLTPQQVSQIAAIRKDFADSTQAARADVQAMVKEMGDLWKANNPDAPAIKNLAAQIDAARAAIRDSGIDHAVAAFNVLNDAQKAKVREVACKNPGMCLGAGCGFGACCGFGPGCGVGMGKNAAPGCGVGCGLGPGAGQGRNMGRGMGPGAGGANCPFAK